MLYFNVTIYPTNMNSNKSARTLISMCSELRINYVYYSTRVALNNAMDTEVLYMPRVIIE